MGTAQNVLEVEQLETVFDTPRGPVAAVRDLSLTVGRGEIVGLVGESGSGKSVTGLSIMGLLDRPGRVAAGRILLARNWSAWTTRRCAACAASASR